ncbi:MAG: FRG domain-containing protein [Methanotrichaceae archaeon]|nr:FRG domain-containing protein [Methanotrichaceae archaeon]
MAKKYEIRSLDHAITIAKDLPGRWFRGHEKPVNDLVPRVFRKDIPQDSDIEFEYIEKFKRYAIGLVDNPPQRDDHLSWLVLMQHYGMPTRLLDWTESALIALYFSVCKDMDSDGELWALNPDSLNKSHRKKHLFGIATIDNLYVRFLSEQPMFKQDSISQEHLLIKYEIATDDIPKNPIALQVPMLFPRMLSQLSTFTIHPRQKFENKITQILRDKKFLVKYIVPQEEKKEILKDLKLIGIKKRLLFPDLESLSEDLRDETHSSDSYNDNLPRPPKF